ncbi:MAG: Rieske (2Fe-2S) protein [Longimicrobiales bacterium]
MKEPEQHNSCDGCSHFPTRREFLRDTGVIAAAALASLGVRPLLAESLPATWIDAASTDTTSTDAGIVSYPTPAQNGVSIDRKNEVVLTRWQGAVYAFALSCPHQKTALRWIEADTRFQCPKHKSKYQPDGTFISGKATRGIDRYAIKQDSGMITVDTAVVHRQDKDAAGWTNAMIKVPNEK